MTSILLGFFIGLLLKETYESIHHKPYRWSIQPIIVNCANQNIPEDEVLDAIKYWEENGEEVGFYSHSPPDGVCDNEGVAGFIFLRMAEPGRLDNNTLASTRRYTRLSELRSSTIWFKEGSYDLYLLMEHEIGHALGYAHVNELGNIMNPTYEFIGENFTGNKDE